MRMAARRPEKALSARFVETVTDPGKYFDGQGLFQWVAKNGAKQWVQRITIRGKRCELGLGSPPAVTLAAARKVALENRGKAMLGVDPLAEKRAARGRLTFAAAIDRYAAVMLSEIKGPKDRKRWRTLFEVYAYPRDMAEIALAHWMGSEVERAYQRFDMLERRPAMMADWVAFLRGPTATESNVVKFGEAG